MQQLQTRKKKLTSEEKKRVKRQDGKKSITFLETFLTLPACPLVGKR
jgi:hypothetical protein